MQRGDDLFYLYPGTLCRSGRLESSTGLYKWRPQFQVFLLLSAASWTLSCNAPLFLWESSDLKPQTPDMWFYGDVISTGADWFFWWIPDTWKCRVLFKNHILSLLPQNKMHLSKEVCRIHEPLGCRRENKHLNVYFWHFLSGRKSQYWSPHNKSSNPAATK